MRWAVLSVSFMVLSFIVFLNVLLAISFPQLGKTTDEIQIEKEKTAQEKKLQEEILLWHEQLADKPDYRDAYLKLALLNWKLGRKYEAYKFLEGAVLIDPNNETAKELLKDFQQE